MGKRNRLSKLKTFTIPSSPPKPIPQFHLYFGKRMPPAAFLLFLPTFLWMRRHSPPTLPPTDPFLLSPLVAFPTPQHQQALPAILQPIASRKAGRASAICYLLLIPLDPQSHPYTIATLRSNLSSFSPPTSRILNKQILVENSILLSPLKRFGNLPYSHPLPS